MRLRRVAKKPSSHNPASAKCGCMFCRNKRSFELPEDLYHELVHGRVVLFAGAGVSTESRSVFPYTLYQDVRHELKLSPSENRPFPDLMSAYCSQPNGRAKLLHKIRDRFEYIRSFPELYRSATRFHVELSTLYPIENIVTTNWDNYFEQQCGATPFVYPEDFTFWNAPGRKVFKIHGSVDSYGSIVATREDYDACQQRLSSGLVGGNLKMLLATKTIVYVGYSFGDDDFIQVYDNLTAEMQGLRPQSYIVTLDEASDERFREKGLVPIYTDAAFFISSIKERLIAEDIMVADDRFDGVSRLLSRVVSEHGKLARINARTYPGVIFALSYQDGLIHALERILNLKKTGYYSFPGNPIASAQLYEKSMRPEKVKKRKYHDVAYVDGYINGLMYVVADNDMRRALDLYYAFGGNEGIFGLERYRRVLKKAPLISPQTHKFARGIVEKMQLSDEVVFHHTPFLL